MASTQEDFETRLGKVEAAYVDLTTRVTALEGTTGQAAPAVSGLSATNITTSGATVSAVVEPRGLTFTWTFEYGTSTSYGGFAPAVAAQAGATEQTVQSQLSGLTAGTTYHYRLVATSSAGTAHSADASFTTAASPTAPTVTLDHSFENTATGTANDQVEYTGNSWTICTGGGCVSTSGGSYHYGYTAGHSYTLRFNGARLVLWAPNDTSGASAAAVLVDGQPAGTANFYEAVSANRVNGVRFDTGVLGTVNADHTVKVTVPSTGGNIVTLFDKADVYRVTAGGSTVSAPVVSSNAATSITNTTAAISGLVTPNGATTSWRFEYGTSTSYGGFAPAPDATVPAGAADAVDATLSGLSPNVTYHYRLHASNSAGSANTADRTFTTLAAAPTIGRITRSGKQLFLNGKQYKFAGMNWDQSIGCGLAGSQPSVDQANRYFAELNPRSMTRIWVLPGMDLANYDRIFNAAKANSQYLCVTLLNGTGACTTFTPSYGTPLASNIASWIDQVCSRHAGEPTVAMYECANEAAESNSNIGNWYQAVAQRIKQNDPQALVGTGGGNSSSVASTIAAFAAGSAIDLISYHDYYSPAGTLGPRASVFNSAANTANKPWYMGERGFCCNGGDTGSLTTNGQRLTTEYGLYLSGSGNASNCAGYFYWDFKLVQPETSTANFGNGLWNAASTFSNPYSGSPATTPQTVYPNRSTVDPAKWRLVFEDSFQTLCNEGQFLSTYTNWGAYPTTYETTSHNGHYDPATISVKDSTDGYRVMNCRMRVSGEPVCSAPYPKYPGQSRASSLGLKVEIRMRVPNPTSGWKTAYLTWPDSETWPRDGELDWCEGQLTGNIGAFFHRQGATTGGDQMSFTSSAAYSGWHTVGMEWRPADQTCKWFVDGSQIGSTMTSRVPNTPMHLVLQAEDSGSPSQEVNIQIDWIACHVPA